MTAGEERDILNALHSLELRLTEKLARVETKLEHAKGDHTAHGVRIHDLEKACEEERQAMRDRTNRLLIGLIAVALVAGVDILAKASLASGVIG